MYTQTCKAFEYEWDVNVEGTEIKNECVRSTSQEVK
jgi:hypothetical protein